MLAATLALTAGLAIWRSSIEGLSPFEVRICLVVFSICSAMLLWQLLDGWQRFQSQRHTRRWMMRAE
ncbi:MAG: hypothetical protein R3352_00125 [Salinisphaeraceae bacterium]|nr:hypothetical protein [Salinisphaeraceae bacterium]